MITKPPIVSDAFPILKHFCHDIMFVFTRMRQKLRIGLLSSHSDAEAEAAHMLRCQLCRWAQISQHDTHQVEQKRPQEPGRRCHQELIRSISYVSNHDFPTSPSISKLRP